MNLRKLRREMGKGVAVSRDRKSGEARVEACGLGYRVTEAAFGSERELAAFLKSKLPVMRISNQ
jgi:hypothetical protein